MNTTTAINLRPDAPPKVTQETTMAQRLRQLAEWCDEHSDIAGEIFAPNTTKVQMHAEDFLRLLNDGRVIDIEPLEGGDVIYSAMVDGVIVVACEIKS